MITLSLLLIVALIVLAFLGAFATGFVLVFGDLIIFILIIVGIAKLIKYCTNKKNE